MGHRKVFTEEDDLKLIRLVRKGLTRLELLNSFPDKEPQQVNHRLQRLRRAGQIPKAEPHRGSVQKEGWR